MNEEALRYRILSDCLDSLEPLFVLLESNKPNTEYIKMLVDLVNEGFLKCCHNGKELCSISVSDITAYLITNEKEGIKSGDIPESWENMFEFIVAEKGKNKAMSLFSQAKERTLNLSKNIDKFKVNKGIYPELLDNILIQNKPFGSFGEWKYMPSCNHYLIGFQEFDDDNGCHLYDPFVKKWQWYD